MLRSPPHCKVVLSSRPRRGSPETDEAIVGQRRLSMSGKALPEWHLRYYCSGHQVLHILHLPFGEAGRRCQQIDDSGHEHGEAVSQHSLGARSQPQENGHPIRNPEGVGPDAAGSTTTEG